MKPRFVNFYIGMAEHCASMSRGVRAKVGAVIVKDDNVLSFSWNGTPRGMDNGCEFVDDDGNLTTKPEVIHAEANALYKLARANESGKDAEMFITHSPCIHCALGIIQTGIRKVYYKYSYRDTKGIDLLLNNGVEVEKVDVSENDSRSGLLNN